MFRVQNQEAETKVLKMRGVGFTEFLDECLYRVSDLGFMADG